MFGNTGFHHPRTKTRKRTKKELAALLVIEARSHANECERLAVALRITHPESPAASALEKAAQFLRRFTEGSKP